MADSFWRRVRAARVPSVATWALLFVAIVVNAIIQPTFFSPYSITSNFATFVPLVTVAVAQSIVVIGGGLDLSLGAIVAFSSVVALKAMAGQDSLVAVGFVVAVAVGLACGLVNGIVIAYVRLQPLIATFATASIFTGATLVVLPAPGGDVPPSLGSAYRASLVGVPIPVLAVLVVAGLWLVLRRTTFARHLYAVGGDDLAAFASLVDVPRVRMTGYALAGGFSGLASMALLANTGSGDPFVGTDIALNSIAAVVVGGIALSGGRGGAIGAIAGAIILSVITNILFFLNVPTTYRQLASGLIIIGALALSVLSARRSVEPERVRT